ncbi:MAG: hypothetical protein V3T90_10545 [Anaerolineae bacterium]
MTRFTIPDYLHTIPLPTPFPVGPVNVHLAEGEPLTLVDAGPRYDPARQLLPRPLRGHRAPPVVGGRGPGDVRRAGWRRPLAAGGLNHTTSPSQSTRSGQAARRRT